MQLPVGSGRRFCRGCVSVSIEAQPLLRSVGLHLPTPTFPHTPWGLLSWLLDRTAITATSGYGVPCGLPGVSLASQPLSLDCATPREERVWYNIDYGYSCYSGFVLVSFPAPLPQKWLPPAKDGSGTFRRISWSC